MSTTVMTPGWARRRLGRLGTLLRTAHAVAVRELRSRMRGRRAFLITAVAALLMGLFVMALHQVLAVRSLGEVAGRGTATGIALDAALSVDQLSGTASVRIGRAIFVGLLGLLTVITLVVAPALASGAVSSEREKQTLELVVTSPISTAGLVLGKLTASLASILIVVAASLPLMCIAFAFGGIGPEDVLSAYVLVLAIAFGTAALGLYLSALIGRTQIAALASYLVLVGVMGITLVANGWLSGTLDLDVRRFDGGGESGAERRVARAERKAQAAERRRIGRVLLVANPLMADLDIICGAMPRVRGACEVSFAAGPVSLSVDDSPDTSTWPLSAAAFGGVGVVLVLLATQHVSPTRRFRPLRRLRLRRRRRRAAVADPTG